MIAAGASAAILANFLILNAEAALIGGGVLLTAAGIYGFRVLRRTL